MSSFIPVFLLVGLSLFASYATYFFQKKLMPKGMSYITKTNQYLKCYCFDFIRYGLISLATAENTGTTTELPN